MTRQAIEANNVARPESGDNISDAGTEASTRIASDLENHAGSDMHKSTSTTTEQFTNETFGNSSDLLNIDEIQSSMGSDTNSSGHSSSMENSTKPGGAFDSRKDQTTDMGGRITEGNTAQNPESAENDSDTTNNPASEAGEKDSEGNSDQSGPKGENGSDVDNEQSPDTDGKVSEGSEAQTTAPQEMGSEAAEAQASEPQDSVDVQTTAPQDMMSEGAEAQTSEPQERTSQANGAQSTEMNRKPSEGKSDKAGESSTNKSDQSGEGAGGPADGREAQGSKMDGDSTKPNENFDQFDKLPGGQGDSKNPFLHQEPYRPGDLDGLSNDDLMDKGPHEKFEGDPKDYIQKMPFNFDNNSNQLEIPPLNFGDKIK